MHDRIVDMEAITDKQKSVITERLGVSAFMGWAMWPKGNRPASHYTQQSALSNSKL